MKNIFASLILGACLAGGSVYGQCDTRVLSGTIATQSNAASITVSGNVGVAGTAADVDLTARDFIGINGEFTVNTGSTLDLFIANCAATSACSNDADALAAIYTALGGANWINKAGWAALVASSNRADFDLNKLAGVTAVANRVVVLRLKDNNLVGSVPPEIGCLTQLNTLSLGGNKIDRIPEQLDHLDNVQGLYFDNNQIVDVPNGVGKMDKLLYLGLAKNNIRDFNPAICNTEGLVTLNLENNKLQTLSPEIGKLKNLWFLYLNNNQLSKLPEELINVGANNKFDVSAQNMKPSGLASVSLSSTPESDSVNLYLKTESTSGNAQGLVYLGLQDNVLEDFIDLSSRNFYIKNKLELDLNYFKIANLDNWLQSIKGGTVEAKTQRIRLHVNDKLLSIAADNNATYQWFGNDVAIHGATKPSFDATDRQPNDNVFCKKTLVTSRNSYVAISNIVLVQDLTVPFGLNLKTANAETNDEELKQLPAATLYPNPITSGETLTIKLEGYSPKTLYIANALGQTVKTEKSSGGNELLKVSTERMEKGLYVVKVVSEGKTEMHRFVVR